MVNRFLLFLRAVSIRGLGRFGVALTTASFLTFVGFQVASLMGLVRNAYAGLILYLVLPALFVLGLVIIPFAWWRQRRATGKGVRELVEERVGEEGLQRSAVGAPLVRAVAVLTLVNVIFLGVASIRGLHFMEDPEFCGTACHAVMSPEWTVYQVSPHARVACVECHVGEGAQALFESKLNGAWQMVSAAFDLYERPIPTPVHQLRPARETCEKCHWPDKFYGQRLESIVRYQFDEASTPLYTTLSLKIDGANGRGGSPSGVHWHIAEQNAVRYASVGDEREDMVWVEVQRPDGSWERFENDALRPGLDVGDAVRDFDCVDCHNRATHVYEKPEFAVDERLRQGLMDRRLPFLKREAVAALTSGYPDHDAAMAGIENHMGGYYRRNHPEVSRTMGAEIDQAVQVLRDVYDRNIHHRMKVEWGSYPSQLGHTETAGCFRCHNQNLKNAEGRWISDDCTLCHSILANGEPDPFEYLKPDPEGEDAVVDPAHVYLREEFFRSFER